MTAHVHIGGNARLILVAIESLTLSYAWHAFAQVAAKSTVSVAIKRHGVAASLARSSISNVIKHNCGRSISAAKSELLSFGKGFEAFALRRRSPHHWRWIGSTWRYLVAAVSITLLPLAALVLIVLLGTALRGIFLWYPHVATNARVVALSATIPILTESAIAWSAIVRAGKGIFWVDRPSVTPSGFMTFTPAKLERGIPITWPSTMVFRVNRRRLLAQAQLLRLRGFHYFSMSAVALLITKTISPDPWAQTNRASETVAIACAVYPLAFFILTIGADFRRQRPLAIQIQLLRCLVSPVHPAWSHGFLDPIGTHRSALSIAARQLRKESSALQARAGSAPQHPLPIILTAVALRIEEALSGPGALAQSSVDDLQPILFETVGVLAGSRNAYAQAYLSEAVQAFGDSGEVSPNIVIAPLRNGRILRFFGSVGSGVKATSDALKSLAGILVILVVAILLIRHRLSLTWLTGWTP